MKNYKPSRVGMAGQTTILKAYLLIVKPNVSEGNMNITISNLKIHSWLETVLGIVHNNNIPWLSPYTKEA